MMYWNNGSWGWAAWTAMIVANLAFWGFVAWIAVVLIRSANREGGSRETSAEDVLDQRLARGEIDVEEYQRRLDALQGRGRPTS